MPGCGASGDAPSPTPDLFSFRGCGRGPLPTGCGCGGCVRGNPSQTPQRALWQAGFARCGGGTRASEGGASCLGVGRPGSGALPPPTTPFGPAAGARFSLAPGAVCGHWGLASLGTFSRAAVRRVLCALPGFAAAGGRCGLAPVLVLWLWPATCLPGVPRGPALVRRASSGPVALGAPVGFPVAVVPSPGPGAVAPGFTGWLRGARGGRLRTGLFVPAAGPCRGKGAGPAPRHTRSGPRDGVTPGGSLKLRSWAACAAVVWCVLTGSLTRPVSHTVRLSTGDSAGVPGLFRVDADTSPFWSEGTTPGSRACARVRAFLAGSGGPASRARFGAPHLFLWPFLVLFLSARPPPGWGRPACGFSCFLPFCAPLVSSVSCLPALGALGLGVLCAPPPPLFFFFPSFLFCAPLVSGVPCFPALGALGPGVLRPLPLPCFVFFPSFPCRGLPVVRCCGAVCHGLWGVLVRVAVGLVLRWGPVCACAPSFGAPCPCLLLLCCCLLCCASPVGPSWRRCSPLCCLWCLPVAPPPHNRQCA